MKKTYHKIVLMIGLFGFGRGQLDNSNVGNSLTNFNNNPGGSNANVNNIINNPVNFGGPPNGQFGGPPNGQFGGPPIGQNGGLQGQNNNNNNNGGNDFQGDQGNNRQGMWNSWDEFMTWANNNGGMLRNGDEMRNYINSNRGNRKDSDQNNPFERPCPSFDVHCVRRFFVEHSYCKPVKGPAPDPIFRAQAAAFYPASNLTETMNNILIRGINGRIDEFYIDRVTDKLVIAIEFRDLVIATNTSFFRFHRNGREPIITEAFRAFRFESVIMTSIIPQLDNLRLDKAEVTAFVNDLKPSFIIGATVAKSSDPLVPLVLAKFLANTQTDIQEYFLTTASYYPSTYIQYNICDFGLTIL